MGWGDILLLMLVALLAAAAGWAVGLWRTARRRGAFQPRRLARLVVARRVRAGRSGFIQVFPGSWMTLVPDGVDLDRALGPGEAWASRKARGEPLVRFTLADLAEAGHPAVEAFEPAVGLEPGELAPDRVVFTTHPGAIRQAASAALSRHGLDATLEEPFVPSAEEPFGHLVVVRGAFTERLALSAVVAEALCTVGPLEALLADRAVALRARLECYETLRIQLAEEAPGSELEVEGTVVRVRREGRPDARIDVRALVAAVPGGREGWAAALREALDGGAEWDGGEGPFVLRRLVPLDEARGLAHLDRGGHAEVFSRVEGGRAEPVAGDAAEEDVRRLAEDAAGALDRHAFQVHAIVGDDPETEGPAGYRCLVLIGPDAASLAAHPSLLLAACERVGLFARGDRVRVIIRTTSVLVLGEARTPEAALDAWRKAGLQVAEAVGLSAGGPLSLDLTLSLSEPARGAVELFRVGPSFFAGMLQERTARLEGDLGRAAQARGLMRLALGDPEGARAHLAEAVRLAPEDPRALLALGTLLNDVGEHARAEEVLRAAVGRAPDDGALNNNLGVAYQGLGRSEEASLFFEKARQLLPTDPLVRVNIGRLHLEEGDADAAERAFRDALGLEPDSVPALAGLVHVAIREGDPDLARRRLKDALEAAPGDETLLRLHRAMHPEETVH